MLRLFDGIGTASGEDTIRISCGGFLKIFESFLEDKKMQFFWGMWTILILFFSLFTSSECVRKNRLDRPIIHWLLGVSTGISMLSSVILGIWG